MNNRLSFAQILNKKQMTSPSPSDSSRNSRVSTNQQLVQSRPMMAPQLQIQTTTHHIRNVQCIQTPTRNHNNINNVHTVTHT